MHYLVNRNEETMLNKFFIAQWKYPCKDDWTELVKKDLADFQIPEELDYLKSISVYSFKTLVKKKAKELAFYKFMSKKTTMSKLSNLFYTDLEIQSYLKSDIFSVPEARMIFSFRTRMAPFRNNFKNLKETTCPLCSSHIDDQNSMNDCPVLVKHFESLDIEAIYSTHIPKNLVTNIIKIVKFRNISL